MKKTFKLFCALLILLPGLSAAFDFGVILDQNLSYIDFGGNANTEYTGSLLPRFLAPVGDNGLIYVSAGINMEYVQGSWRFVPELLRTEFTLFLRNSDLTAGRMFYSDPLGFIATGLFDGARFSFDTPMGTFSAGAWYTGFLYKRRASITMNDRELELFHEELDFNDFANTYFAPRRFITAMEWENPNIEHPNLGTTALRGRVALMCQFDFTGQGLHSQYLTGRLSVPLNAFLLDFGGSLSFIQDSGNFAAAIAAEFGTSWTLPVDFGNRLSLLFRYTGQTSGHMRSFLPITTISQGSVLRARASGLTMISLDYLARLNRTFVMNLQSSYFIRNDFETYRGFWFLNADRGRFLGNEFFGQFFWSPVSDMTMNFGAGVFLPSWGNAVHNPVNLWRVEINLVFSLF